MKFWLVFFLSFVFIVSLSIGQEAANHNVGVKSLGDFFRNGNINGHVRYHFMGTFNEGELLDYHTHAFGSLLGYSSQSIYGFSFGVEGSYTHNLGGSDLLEVDPLTAKKAKWEAEMYDYLHTSDQQHLFRLNQLYLKFKRKKVVARIGKLDINQGPLFLKRDGRMNPFVYQGLWVDINKWKKNDIHLGWINGVSPRGLTRWYSINEAIGLNNNGFEPNGQPANYHEEANSHGIGVIGLKRDLSKSFSIQVWNYYFHHLMNTTWVQADFQRDNYILGFQYAHQKATSFQSNLAYQNRYIQPNENANVVSLLAGYKISKLEFTFSYLHSFKGGRFLFPRELGRENFYVSQPRAWIDGYGNTDVFMFRLKYNPTFLKKASIDLRLSKIVSPELAYLEFNKYKLRSFYQSTLILKKEMTGKLDGLSFEVLYVARVLGQNQGVEIKEKPYKYNFDHLNVRAQITF